MSKRYICDYCKRTRTTRVIDGQNEKRAQCVSCAKEEKEKEWQTEICQKCQEMNINCDCRNTR